MELPLIEMETRWEVRRRIPTQTVGIDETMSSTTKHSVFGV